MSTRSRLPSLALAGLLVLAAFPAAAAGLACPGNGKGAPDGPLFEAIAKPGAAAGSNRALHQAVKRLRAEGLSNGAIIDHAVASYCPLVDRDGSLTLPQKQAALRSFAAQLTTLVYDPSQDETRILLDVPVSTALSDQIDAAAAKAKESRDAWIVRTLEAGIDGR
ncbi:hypothetical protein [Methylobacterium platani]|uniref:Glutelin n=2 Tax=Methylobacterium platani TaxID=427683 RepID=A0A179SJG3_9HYPH|nr:hypothetical protein [Methylobacterium platani]KMO19401.1 hypothetical protein SQ03_08175 [Methylobacterium platani JCM 14648]OAS26694.1 hypothetical protein A5481_04390 [Methylobacterium platani]